MKFTRLLIISCVLFSLMVAPADANPTQYGDTGLLTQPTAETLNAGNICLGVWTQTEDYQGDTYSLVPASITLGLGSFLEAYASFPNVLLNGEETWSQRGFANVGFKLRFWGERSSAFKMAIDGQGKRKLSDDPKTDGLTDYQYRLIASYKKGPFGIHLNAGKVETESPEGRDFEDQFIYGGGVEFYPTARLRLIAEVYTKTEKVVKTDDFSEAFFGLQYYMSPHLTLNLGGGVGLTDLSPDTTILLGFSACQGIGTYLTPVPQLVQRDEKKKSDETKKEKVIKIKALTPLKSKIKKKELSAVSKLEVPLDGKQEEVLVSPSEKLALVRPKISRKIPVSPVAEFVKSAPVAPAAKVVTEPIMTLVHRKFRLPEFTFGSNQTELSQEGKEAITAIIEEVRKENAWFIIRAEGHTDSVGSDLYNERLSLKRAISAATHLVLNTGFDPEAIFVKGLGESTPIADNLTDEGRSQNRRVELLVLLPK